MDGEPFGWERKSFLICRHTRGAASEGGLAACGRQRQNRTHGMSGERSHLREKQLCTTSGHVAQLRAEGGYRGDMAVWILEAAT